MADMASRISDLEKSLVQAREGADGHVVHPQTPVSGSVHSSPSEQPTTATPGDDVNVRDGAGREDILVQKGSSSQYFNEIILSRVIGEVCFVYMVPFGLPLTLNLGTRHPVRLGNTCKHIVCASHQLPFQYIRYSFSTLDIGTSVQFSSAKDTGFAAMDCVPRQCGSLSWIEDPAYPH